MPNTQINKQPLYQQAYAILREEILSGDRAPGSRLDVQTVADELGISRTPVREAIRQLVQQSLLESDADGRVRVFNPSVRELADMYVVRAAIESTAAVAVTNSFDDLDITPIESALAMGRAAIDTSDWEQAVEASTAWHYAVMELSGNILGLRILEDLRLHVLRHRSISMHVPDRRRAVQEDHELVLDLMREGEATAVRETVTHHILNSGYWAVSRLRAELTSSEKPSPSEAYMAHVVESSGEGAMPGFSHSGDETLAHIPADATT